jgi:hypothetical protein
VGGRARRLRRPCGRSGDGPGRSGVPIVPCLPYSGLIMKDAAEIQGMQAATIRTLIEAGFEPDAVVSAVTAGDLNRLGSAHTGLVPVQLQCPAPTRLHPNPSLTLTLKLVGRC